MDDGKRTVHKLLEGTWIFVEFSDLKSGDIFRMFDDDLPVINEEGFTIFQATSDAYLNDDGIWEIKTE